MIRRALVSINISIERSYLKKLEIGIGTKVSLVEKIAFDNLMVIRIGKNIQFTVSRVFSQNLPIYA
jgi:hypothetical protein